MVPFGAVLILLIIFGSITTVILGLVYLRNKNKERMLIMEKEIDPEMLKTELKPSGYISLKVGVFLIGLAVGIIVGALLVNYTFIFPDEQVSYFSSIFLFGGLSLILSNFIGKSKKDAVKK